MLALPERTASGCGAVAVGKGLPGRLCSGSPCTVLCGLGSRSPAAVCRHGPGVAARSDSQPAGPGRRRGLCLSLSAEGGRDCGLWDKVLGTAPSSICDGSFYVSAWLGHGAQVCRSLTERLKLGCARGFCPGRDLRVTPPRGSLQAHPGTGTGHGRLEAEGGTLSNGSAVSFSDLSGRTEDVACNPEEMVVNVPRRRATETTD